MGERRVHRLPVTQRSSEGVEFSDEGVAIRDSFRRAKDFVMFTRFEFTA